MSDGSAELQIAVFELLNGLTPALAANGVHAPAPNTHPLPYVEIGESDAIQADVQCRTGLEETITIHVWTLPSSQLLAKQIMSRIRDALHQKNLTVSGRSSALAQISSSRLFTDEDGLALHGVVSLTVTHFS